MKTQYPITFFCLNALAHLPFPLIRGLGWLFGSVVYAANRSRRTITQRNLAIAFPDLNDKALRALAKAHIRCLAVALFDRMWLWFAPLPTVYARVHLSGLEHLSAPETDKPRPTIFLVPHFAGLDTAAPALVAACAAAGLPPPKFTTIFQPQKTRWEDTLFRQGRGRYAETTQYTRHDGIRPVMRDMKAGHAYYCLPDNDFGSKDAVFVPFFGELAATVTVLPRLSRALNARVIPLIARMTQQGYTVQAMPACDHLENANVEDYCAQMNAAIEGWARTMPEQYLFSHRRYKTRPEGSASIY